MVFRYPACYAGLSYLTPSACETVAILSAGSWPPVVAETDLNKAPSTFVVQAAVVHGKISFNETN